MFNRLQELQENDSLKNLFALFLVESPSMGIASLYALGEGCETPYANSLCSNNRCHLLVNGALVSGMRLPGFNIITLDPDSFSVKEQKFYNTHSSSANVQSMMTWLRSLVDGTLLMGCSNDEPTKNMQSADWTLLVSLPIVDILFRDSAKFIL